jgi:hypothetical protein
MKRDEHPPRTATPQHQQGLANGVHPRLSRGCVRGTKAPQSRAQQKTGGYRRVEVFLAVEAAIALRQLMRDGRSARDVIEAVAARKDTMAISQSHTLGRKSSTHAMPASQRRAR